MRKLLFIVVPFLLAVFLFSGIAFLMSRNAGKGALQVTANPKSSVYLNGKLIGQTPLCKCDPQDMLMPSDYTIRLVPQSGGLSPFEEKIKITQSVLTVVDRTFGKGAGSEGSVITLIPLSDSKGMQLLVISFPQGSDVLLDSEVVGQTPLLLKNITASDHELKIKKSGYREKSVRIRTVVGYKLEALVFLGIEAGEVKASPTPGPSLSATPVPIASVSILNTPTGFLRVRASASLSAAEIARVTPGETFELIQEESGWFAIKLKDGRTGWVSRQYAQKQ